ncbi:hypothetical protein [Dethiothermospora halolimnae]|uniref:hypothetical protein n=1 Tax=Dethiothermospora halolimnae TaxID=3114390 RepID=UPI003CCBD258
MIFFKHRILYVIIIFISIFVFTGSYSSTDDIYTLNISSGKKSIKIDLKEIPVIKEYIDSVQDIEFFNETFKNAADLLQAEVIFTNNNEAQILVSYNNGVYSGDYMLIKIDFNKNEYKTLILGRGGMKNIELNISKDKILFHINNREGQIFRSNISILDIEKFILITNNEVNQINNVRVPIVNPYWKSNDVISLQVAVSEPDYESLQSWFERDGKYKTLNIKVPQ